MQKEQISSSLFLFSIGCLIQASSSLTSFLTSVTKQDSWVVVIFGFLVSLPMIWMYTALAAKFPGKSLIEINDIVLGKVFGKIFSVFYIFFFFSLCFLNVNLFGGFVGGSLLPDTPILSIYLLFVLVCTWAVVGGIEVIARYGALFVFLAFATVFLNIVLSWKDIKLINLKPSFTLPFIKYVQGTHITAALPFCDTVVFLMFSSNLKNPRDFGKAFFGGLCIGGATLLIVLLRNIAVLGSIVNIESNPNYEAIRLINVWGFITRMESIYGIMLIILFFFKISILFYVTVKAIEELFHLHSYRILVPSVGALIISFSMIVFSSSAEDAYWGENVVAFYSTFFEVVLPSITFIAAITRFRNRENRQFKT
ncbi:MAG: endospore germination permease [Clostridia bacterium]|nr:endospore germination permease [Clostridia bacterium]